MFYCKDCNCICLDFPEQKNKHRGHNTQELGRIVAGTGGNKIWLKILMREGEIDLTNKSASTLLEIHKELNVVLALVKSVGFHM